MSEHDDEQPPGGAPGGEASDQPRAEPGPQAESLGWGVPDDDRESTQPLSPQQPPQPQQSPAGPQQGSPYPPAPGPYGAPGSPYPGGTGAPGYPGGPGGYGPGYPTTPVRVGYGYPPAPAQRARVSGWVWPVVSVLALVLGLLGGTVAGALVSSSMSSSSEPIRVLGGGSGARPLKADNGSVAAVAARLLPSTVQVNANGGAAGGKAGGATGSGFVVDNQGHIITNNHVVADATSPGALQVVDQHGKTYAARIVGRSPVYDIAVLDVTGGKALPPAALGSTKTMRVGDAVVAIGSPLGLSSTVTSGIVSALDRPVTTSGDSESSYIDAVQTDAAINPGNSGGPLVNMRGQVVGVNSAIATTGGTVGGQSGNIGVGFAIPMEQVRITASQILSTGVARYPIIGANVNTSTTTKGAQIVKVPSGTPADRAGLKEGDVVVEVDHTPVTDGIGLIVAIRAHRPGETITLTVLRDGQRHQVKVRLDSKVG